jgi:bile acid-coenzyme A ligase
MPVASTTLAARIAQVGAERGLAPAVIGWEEDGAERTISWRQLAEEVQRIARRLGAGPTARDAPVAVAVEARNSPSALIRILGALAAEIPVLPLDPRAAPREREQLLSFMAREYGPICLLLADGRLAWGTGSAVCPRGSAGLKRRAGYFLSTGGSSGPPKVVAIPGPLRYDPARIPSSLLRKTRWRNGQRQLLAGPLHHSAPFTHCIHGLLDENTIILQPLFAPDHLLDLIREYSVEWLQLTPTHMRSIVQLASPDPAGMASIRAVLHTAAPCDVVTKKAWLDLVGPARVFECYASTEGVGATLVRGDEWLSRPGTVGKGFLTQIRILDQAGRLMPVDQIGTVYLRSSQQSSHNAYLGGRTTATTPDGFVSVGDHGWLDAEGYLFLAPDHADLINVGGEKVSPVEVEAAILQHRAVLDVMVAGVPDLIFGSVVHARVVLKAGERVTAADLVRHCTARLSPYKVPQRVNFVAEVPRTQAGKLERWRANEQQGE